MKDFLSRRRIPGHRQFVYGYNSLKKKTLWFNYWPSVWLPRFLARIPPGNSGMQDSYQENQESRSPTRKLRKLPFLPRNPEVQEFYQEIQDFPGILAGNSRFSRKSNAGERLKKWKNDEIFPEMKVWDSSNIFPIFVKRQLLKFYRTRNKFSFSSLFSKPPFLRLFSRPQNFWMFPLLCVNLQINRRIFREVFWQN